MAIAMPIQQDIRRYDRQGMPHARIARELGVDRGTVAKYARQEDCSPQPKRDRRFGRKTDAYAALIDQMLEADRMMPRKQRHTARRIFDRLVAEHGFDGSYSVVRHNVKEWRETNRESSDGYLRLEWDPGVMQVDFGVALADVAGVERTVHFLVATLPYSNMRYAVAMPGENAECLCSGLSMVFERMGGVPSVLVMDNATSAGHRDRDGEVTLTHVFASFASHHRMEVRFCNPYSGNEKGNGRTRSVF
ncbi:integrase [Bifidobacterium pseudolongum subsp. globosum]|uniref:Integrase n=1 Tax=Bifidobacterium pseudolongum subsp. globosum TaxID=1690 RepID=A0A4Q5AM93_9BIFI|nr:integrase [Bifidobacterium pseudolongum subsp. globosum]RYQ31087.1 integrase [Bifidobacterium pseudolongum subsp. globosum]